MIVTLLEFGEQEILGSSLPVKSIMTLIRFFIQWANVQYPVLNLSHYIVNSNLQTDKGMVKIFLLGEDAMARFKYSNRKQGRFLPIIPEEQLIPGTLEHTVDYLVEEKMDLSDLMKEFHNDDNGAPAYHPKDLLKVIFFAFMRGIYSTRKIDRVCRENMVFMALCGDSQPDHATIARFISKLEFHIANLFQQLLLYCDSLELLSGSVLAIDGCKIPSHAAKESSGTFSELEEKRRKFQIISKQLLERSKSETSEELGPSIERYRHRIDRIEKFLTSHEKRIGQRGKEVKSNITDNESAKLSGGHGVIQGYYALAAVDEKHQIITTSKTVGTQNEALYLRDMIEDSRKLLPGRITRSTTILADTGYFNEENCRYLFEAGQSAVVPDNHFRQRDPRFKREPLGKDRNPRRKGRNLFENDAFTHNPEKNWYYCPAGKPLRPDGRRNNHGHIGQMFTQKDGDCPKCHLKTKCLKGEAKSRHLFIVDIPRPMIFSDRMRSIIDREEGKLSYSRRMGIVEPVFANITYAKGLNRFRYRGQEKVNSIWMLYCMVHNIEKIHRYGKLERKV